MEIQKAPDISHLDTESIIRITEASAAAQYEGKRQYLDHVIGRIGDLARVDAAHLRKATDLIAAARDNGGCGGGIVCGC